MLKTFSGRAASQNEWELARFLQLLQVRKVRRYLEIGARDGDTLHAVGCALDPGATLMAVDLPGGLWGRVESLHNLRNVSRDLRDRGQKVHIGLGSSQAKEVRYLVEQHGPYDAILIDGDHTYEGVKADWLAYGHLAPLVAFHDIAGHGVVQRTTGHEVEVPRFWSELRNTCDTVEIIGPESLMGLGVITGHQVSGIDVTTL